MTTFGRASRKVDATRAAEFVETQEFLVECIDDALGVTAVGLQPANGTDGEYGQRRRGAAAAHGFFQRFFAAAIAIVGDEDELT